MSHYYLVIGRIIGDDEDTPIQIQALSSREACDRYREEMYAMSDWSDEQIQAAERVGDGVIINHVFRGTEWLNIDRVHLSPTKAEWAAT